MPEDESKWTLKKIGTLIGIVLALFGAAWGVFQFIESTYAKRAKLEVLELRFEQEVLSDRIIDLQKRIWQLEDRYVNIEMPQHVRDEIRELKLELDAKKAKLDKLSVGGAP